MISNKRLIFVIYSLMILVVMAMSVFGVLIADTSPIPASGVTVVDVNGVFDTSDQESVNWELWLSILGIDTNMGTAVFIGLTSSSYDGKFESNGYNGYVSGNALCDINYTDSRMCTVDDILLTIATEDISGFVETAWVAEGAPGYTSNSNDCLGWTSNIATYLGAFWEFDSDSGGMGWLTNCANEKKIACCGLV